MSMNKIKDIPLETTATYQPLSDLNVRFWQQDKGVAELRFLITRNDRPLSLSKENVKIIIALESGENFISSEDFIIDTEVDGVVRFLIPTDFMRVATNVIGQVYVGTLDGDEVLVERQFKFAVSQDLLSNIPVEEKVRYIKTFDDLRIEIGDRLGSIEETLLSLENFIEEIEYTTKQGVDEITNLFNSQTIAFNTNYDEKFNTINTIKTDIETYVADAQADMVAKKAEFDEAVAGSGLVTEVSAENWQKYKMTNDDGSRIYLSKDSFTDITTLPPGLYETVSGVDALAQGFPEGHNDSAFSVIDVTTSGSDRRQIKVVSHYNSKTWVKYIHTNGEDRGWKEIPVVDDVALIETTSNSQKKANTAENNSKLYTDEKLTEQHGVLFNGSTANVGGVINLTDSMDKYKMLVISGSVPGGTFNEVILLSTMGSSINLQTFNLRDTDGMFLGMYEIRMSVNSQTKLTIENDVSYDNISDTGSGEKRNAYTITRIEGFK